MTSFMKIIKTNCFDEKKTLLKEFHIFVMYSY